MKNFSTLLLLFLSHFSFAQINLVPNPSFEDTVSCPDALGEVNRAVGWSSARATPDYFNHCASSGIETSVPSNYFGYQYPASGNAYCGFVAKEESFDYREYTESQLVMPLQIGTIYYVSFKVSLATEECCGCGVNKLGVLFSTINYSYNNPAPICNCSQIYTDSIITKTTNWTMIKGSFIADSSYSYINIGNFFNDSLTDSTQVVGSTCIAYYYLDNICVSTDSAYSYNYIYTGINEAESESSIKCYPNPFKDFITIEDKVSSAQVFKLYNILGQIVRTQANNSQYYIWYLEDLPPGTYNLTIQRKSLITTNRIIIKL